MTDASAPRVATLRRRRQARQARSLSLLLALLLAGVALTLALGQSLIPPLDILRVLAGHDVPGAAAITVLELRLPRALLSVLAGLCFGLAGAACQTVLRNPLASPDIIGITAGASAAAVFAIVGLAWRGPAVSALAVAAGLGTAFAIYLLSWRGGVAGTRLILIGIGIAAMLESATAHILSRAPAWNLQDAMRWLTGSVNGARFEQCLPLVLALAVFGALLLGHARDLEAMRLGDDKAAALGVRLNRVRLVVILSVVALIAFATAATGPIAFVALLSGPIAARITDPGEPLLLAAALVGAALVLFGDYAGQFLLPARYPVGVVTGVLGAPYLIYLIVRVNRTGAAI